MNKYMIDQECESSDCSGGKSLEECPHNGKFDPNSPSCKECEEDALAAMNGGEINETKHTIKMEA